MAPISHVAGTKVLPSLMRGGTVHMLKGFDPEAVFKTIERERINFTLFVPTMIYVLLDHPALDKTDLSSLELLLYGASAMSPSRLVEGIERIGPVFSQLYGQTECYPVSVLRKADHDPKTPELFLSCGFPIAACEVKILDDDDHEVETGEAGEICVRAPHVMAEYWKRPEQTAETLKNGWLHTGDIARADERGYMFILDRKKDMIVSGGFNIFPREVEDVLSQHADVAMVAVVGVPDDKWGEAVTAVIVAREGAPAECGGTDQSRQGTKGLGARAQAHKVRHRVADDRGRQGRQEGAEGGLLGRARADGRIAVSAEQLIEPVANRRGIGANAGGQSRLLIFRRVRSIASRSRGFGWRGRNNRCCPQAAPWRGPRHRDRSRIPHRAKSTPRPAAAQN